MIRVSHGIQVLTPTAVAATIPTSVMISTCREVNFVGRGMGRGEASRKLNIDDNSATSS